VFHLTYLRNEGAAWGILQGYFPLFLIITVIVLSGLCYYFIKIPWDKRYHFLRFTIVLIAAGAVGNFIDRLIFRYVIDFLYIALINFPIFNMADTYVSVSAVLIIYCFLIRYKNEDLVWKKDWDTKTKSSK
jgi:signal peptidase II